jgi:hypothetical protein
VFSVDQLIFQKRKLDFSITKPCRYEFEAVMYITFYKKEDKFGFQVLTRLKIFSFYLSSFFLARDRNDWIYDIGFLTVGIQDG